MRLFFSGAIEFALNKNSSLENRLQIPIFPETFNQFCFSIFIPQESRGKRPLKIWDSWRNIRKGLVVGSFEELIVRGESCQLQHSCNANLKLSFLIFQGKTN